jgi:hypothetical protein
MIDDVACGTKGFVMYVLGVVGVCFRHGYGQVMGYAMNLVKAVSGTHKPDPTMHRPKYHPHIAPSCSILHNRSPTYLTASAGLSAGFGSRTALHEATVSVCHGCITVSAEGPDRSWPSTWFLPNPNAPTPCIGVSSMIIISRLVHVKCKMLCSMYQS